METRRKYKIQGAHPHPHLGSLIKKKIKERGITMAEMSRRLGVKPSVFQGYVKHESLQFGILWKIGIALEHNFFAGLMELLPEHTLNSAKSTFQKTIVAQREEIEELKKEIEIYKNLLKR